jgi:fructose-specific component phosphotransferase system IIB-like protein
MSSSGESVSVGQAMRNNNNNNNNLVCVLFSSLVTNSTFLGSKLVCEDDSVFLHNEVRITAAALAGCRHKRSLKSLVGSENKC